MAHGLRKGLETERTAGVQDRLWVGYFVPGRTTMSIARLRAVLQATFQVRLESIRVGVGAVAVYHEGTALAQLTNVEVR